MGFRQAVNDSLSIVLKSMLIIAIVIGVFWFGLSIWGNIANNDGPDPPDENKAAYLVVLKATGQQIYTDQVSDSGNGIYELNGYYELIKNKWVYNDTILPLDKYYFGDITVRRR